MSSSSSAQTTAFVFGGRRWRDERVQHTSAKVLQPMKQQAAGGTAMCLEALQRGAIIALHADDIAPHCMPHES